MVHLLLKILKYDCSCDMCGTRTDVKLRDRVPRPNDNNKCYYYLQIKRDGIDVLNFKETTVC